MTEAEAMYEYLKAHGIPESQMLLEEQSASTYENLVYSKLLIQEREAKRRQTIRDVMAASGYLSPDRYSFSHKCCCHRSGCRFQAFQNKSQW